jgi:hypothetical protein
MKITRKQLSDLIVEALHFDKFDKCALFKSHARGDDYYLLFNIGFIERLKDMSTDPNIYDSYLRDIIYEDKHYGYLYGMMSVGNPRSPCNAAKQVRLAAAADGWGPTLYDTVMGDYQFGIISDRGTVSPDAFNVYDFYLKNRDDNEITKYPLDSKIHQWTPAPYDDCAAGGAGRYLSDEFNYSPTYDAYKTDPLNWSYNRDEVPNREVLDNNWHYVKNYLKSQVGFDEASINSIFRIIAITFFESLDETTPLF